jgi:NAD kinase
MLQRTPRIVVVTRQTRMEGLLQRWATRGQAKFMFRQAKAVERARAGALDEAAEALAADDADFLELQDEDATYHESVKGLQRELDFGLPVQVIDRQYVPSMDFDLCSVVVVIGQDGLVANTAKYVGGVPIIGVNPDPARFDGVLLPYHLKGAREAVSEVLAGQATISEVTLAQATLHDGQTLLAFNDLFIGAQSHVSARYELTAGGKSEPQSSSGVLVCTGAGSTGWMSSVFNMARGVAATCGQKLDEARQPRLKWDDSALLWAVREPFRSQTSGVSLAAGSLHGDEQLLIESRMASGGVIFSDGVEADFLTFNGGSIARIGIANQRARLVVPGLRRPPRRR